MTDGLWNALVHVRSAPADTSFFHAWPWVTLNRYAEYREDSTLLVAGLIVASIAFGVGEILRPLAKRP